MSATGTGSGTARQGRGRGSRAPADVLSFPGPPPEEADAESTAERLTAVTRLAAQGLDLAEVKARLGLPAEDTPAAEAALRAAMERGRLLGRAAIKHAQYEAALGGRVTAQSQVLARLGADDEEREAVQVTRRVISEGDGHGTDDHAADDAPDGGDGADG